MTSFESSIVVSVNVEEPTLECGDSKLHVLNTGMMLFRPTPDTLFFVDKLVSTLEVQFEKFSHLLPNETRAGGSVSDQARYSRILCKQIDRTKNAVTYIDWEIGPAGSFFKGLDADYFRKGRHHIAGFPFVHHNYVVGMQKKIVRAKKYGLWFLKDNGKTCNMEALNKIVLT